MKKFFVFCAVMLVAAGCQKGGGGTKQVGENGQPPTEFRQTNLATDPLPEFTKEVLVFKTFPPEGSRTNLFLHDAKGDRPYLPKGYYYVPAANKDDVKPALLPNALLVQKGSALAFFNTLNRQMTPLKDVTVPAYATVIALNSMTSDDVLIALIDKDQLSRTPHSSVVYQVNRDTVSAKRIANPLPDNLTATSNRFPIASVLYDGVNNRILQFIYQENGGYTGIQSFDLDTGSQTELMFPELSNVDVTHSYLTVYSSDNSKNTIGIIDPMAKKLALSSRIVPKYKKTEKSSFMTYSYLGKGYLVGLEYMQDNSTQFTMFQEQQNDDYKPIHAVSLPYTFVKAGNDGNLYLVLSSPELMQARIAQYDVLSNRFTGMLSVPGLSSGEMEFLK